MSFEEMSFKASNSGRPSRVQISLRIIAVKLINSETKRELLINALLDDGNMRTIVNDRVRDFLGLTGYHEKVSMTGVHGHVTKQLARICEVKISSVDGDFAKNIPIMCMTKEILPDLIPIDWAHFKYKWKHLAPLPLLPPRPGGVDMMIGNDQVELMQALEEVADGPDDPVARLTKLGWTVAGPVHPEEVEAVRKSFGLANSMAETAEDLENHFTVGTSISPTQKVHDSYDDYLHELVKSRYQMEDLEGDDEDPAMSAKNRRLMSNLQKSLKYIEVDGQQRIQAKCLWRPGEPQLFNNRKQAESRMFGWEKSAAVKSDEAWNLYRDKIMSHVKKGQVIECTDRPSDAYYLSHFGVFKTHPVTKAKVFDRAVFDGRAKYFNKSLNDAIYPGPNLANELVVVMLRFRHKQIAICSDISEMFLNIVLAPEDRVYHRFLFRPDRDGETREFEFQRHTFGNCGSPCVANYVIRHHAQEKEAVYPLAAKAIQKSTLMDDTLVSVRTVEEGQELVRQLTELTGGIGMRTHKMASNVWDVLGEIEPDRRAKEFVLPSNEDTDVRASMKTLGIMWDADSDLLAFRPMKFVVDQYTLRKILKVTNTLYDPLSVVVPFAVLARFILRRCWQNKLKWDEFVPEDIESDFRAWENQLQFLDQVKLERCLSPSLGKPVKEEIHIFCDASKLAYGAVAYYRTVYDTGQVTVRWIMARARIAPINPERSIPRLELLAAELALKLLNTVRTALEIPLKDCHFWTDSACVLIWIISTTKALVNYVARRVMKIQDLTLVENWHWIDTDNNPADVISRGCTLEELIHHELYKSGPELLKDREIKYPVRSFTSPSPDELEVKAGQQLVVAQLREVPEEGVLIDFEKFKGRTWEFTIRAVARVLKFIARVRKTTRDVHLTPDVMEKSKNLLLKWIQMEGFQQEREQILTRGRVHMRSSLAKWSPDLNEHGIMVVNGRLKYNQRLSVVMRHPVLLPKEHIGTTMIIKDAHCRKLIHSTGVHQTFSVLRAEYWIQGGRATVRRAMKGCVRCKRLRSQAIKIPEGPLPDFRLPLGDKCPYPFQTTAIDCAGPIEVSMGARRKPEKRYLLILTCTAYRCVDIQVMHGMSTDDFFIAFSNFLYTQGRPKLIVSDNGSNFRKAEALFCELLEGLTKTYLGDNFPRIAWKFGPAYAPYYTGIVERMVQKVKKVLNATLVGVKFTDPELLSAVNIARSFINNYPLTYEMSGADEPMALTPNHFLAARTFADLAPFISSDTTKLERWRLLQKTMDENWRRFQKEVAPELHKFSKVVNNQETLEPGDVVILLDKKDRGEWPLGRILDSDYSRDGRIRRVRIRYNKGIAIRHPRNLVKLVAGEKEEETDNQEEEKEETDDRNLVVFYL
jgi:hypothetical protein